MHNSTTYLHMSRSVSSLQEPSKWTWSSTCKKVLTSAGEPGRHHMVSVKIITILTQTFQLYLRKFAKLLRVHRTKQSLRHRERQDLISTHVVRLVGVATEHAPCHVYKNIFTHRKNFWMSFLQDYYIKIIVTFYKIVCEAVVFPSEY